MSPFFVCAMGLSAFRQGSMVLEDVLRGALGALDMRLADWELSNHGKMLRVFIEKGLELSDPSGGVSLLDCETASKHLQRVLEVEGIDYDRLEVSSPGLDRRLKTAEDFARFAGHQVDVHLRTLVAGRRHLVGELQTAKDGEICVVTDSGPILFGLSNLKKARLVPRI